MEDLGAITDTAAEVLPPVHPGRSAATRRINMAKSVWTADRIDRLKVLFGDGLSCGLIAKDLGDGISRNAVIGKINRMGLRPPEKRQPSVCKPARTSAGRSRKSRTEPAKPLTLFWRPHDKPPLIPETDEPVVVDFVPTNPVRLVDAGEFICRWPLGEPSSEMLVCGEPTRDQLGCPYCSIHAARAYVSSAPRKPWVEGRAEG